MHKKTAKLMQGIKQEQIKGFVVPKGFRVATADDVRINGVIWYEKTKAEGPLPYRITRVTRVNFGRPDDKARKSKNPRPDKYYLYIIGVCTDPDHYTFTSTPSGAGTWEMKNIHNYWSNAFLMRE